MMLPGTRDEQNYRLDAAFHYLKKALTNNPHVASAEVIPDIDRIHLVATYFDGGSSQLLHVWGYPHHQSDRYAVRGIVAPDRRWRNGMPAEPHHDYDPRVMRFVVGDMGALAAAVTAHYDFSTSPEPPRKRFSGGFGGIFKRARPSRI